MQLHGFNNLTKSLSFNIYDICYAPTEQQQAYIEYIDEAYNAKKLTHNLNMLPKLSARKSLTLPIRTTNLNDALLGRHDVANAIPA